MFATYANWNNSIWLIRKVKPIGTAKAMRRQNGGAAAACLQFAVTSIRHEHVAAAVVREAIDRVSGE